MKNATYKFDGLEDAVIGVATQATGDALLVYSYPKMVEIFMRDGMSKDEAEDYIGFNIINLNLGERTPLIMSPYTYEEAVEMLYYADEEESSDEGNH